MLSYSINSVFDDKAVNELINASPTNRMHANRLVGLIILRDIGKRFDNQGAPPAKWVDLKEETIKRRRKGKKTGRGVRILIDDGTLKRSFMPGDKNNLYATDANNVVVGTKLIYAAPHQFGFKKLNIPARPMVYSPADLPELQKQIIAIYKERLFK